MRPKFNVVFALLAAICLGAIWALMEFRCNELTKQRDQAWETASRQNELIQRASVEMRRLQNVIDKLDHQVWRLQIEKWFRQKPNQDCDDAQPVPPREKPLA